MNIFAWYNRPQRNILVNNDDKCDKWKMHKKTFLHLYYIYEKISGNDETVESSNK